MHNSLPAPLNKAAEVSARTTTLHCCTPDFGSAALLLVHCQVLLHQPLEWPAPGDVTGRRLDWMLNTLLNHVEPDYQQAAARNNMKTVNDTWPAQSVAAAAEHADCILDCLVVVHASQ